MGHPGKSLVQKFSRSFPHALIVSPCVNVSCLWQCFALLLMPLTLHWFCASCFAGKSGDICASKAHFLMLWFAVSFQMVIILYGVLIHVRLHYSLNFIPQWYCWRIFCINWFFSHSVQTGYAVSTANVLLQAVEVALPKQKKAQAVSEFKHSIIAHKRRARVQQNSGTW